MSSFADDFELHDDQPSVTVRWILPGLIISLLLHVIFFMWARGYPIAPFSPAYYEKIVPRTFQLERVEIDPKLLEPLPDEENKAATAPTAVQLPEEKISFESMMSEVRASPAAPKIENPLLSDTPKVQETTLADTVKTAERSGAQSVVEDMDSLREELLVDKPEVSGRPLLDLGASDGGGSARVPDGPMAGSATPGFSNLDDLLAQTGPLSDATAPILMPADLLYDYDSDQLRIEAMTSLRKLGQIIARNPQADFIIEGHSDSFGPDGYNLDLSRRRAVSVKNWLVQAMGVDPARIRTRGYGKSRLIAPDGGSIEEQQINRRVEIVIRSRIGR